jgi:hypothetical protein
VSFFLLAAGVGGLLSVEVAEQLRYSRDILKPYAKWSVKDLSDSFFVAKPLAPDEYETLVAKYRERERADRAAKQQQQQPQQQQQQHLANGQHRDRWASAGRILEALISSHACLLCSNRLALHAAFVHTCLLLFSAVALCPMRQSSVYIAVDVVRVSWCLIRSKPVPSPMRSSHAQPVDGAASGAGGAGRMDRERSRRERVFERETREANRLLRKVGAGTMHVAGSG